MTSFAHEHSLKHQALSLMVDPGGANLDGDAKLAEAESNTGRERERERESTTANGARSRAPGRAQGLPIAGRRRSPRSSERGTQPSYRPWTSGLEVRLRDTFGCRIAYRRRRRRVLPDCQIHSLAENDARPFKLLRTCGGEFTAGYCLVFEL